MDNKDEDLRTQDQQDNKKQARRTLKTVMVTVVCTLLVVIILLFVVLICLKGGCNKNKSNSSNTSSSYTKIYDNKKLDIVFKKIVNQRLIVNGFDTDNLKDVYAVSYIDNYPNSFSLSISVSSESSKMYYYSLDNTSYPDNKDGYDNFVSYLLSIDSNNDMNYLLEPGTGINDNVSLVYEDILINERINNTSKANNRYYLTSDSGDKHLTGYYVENDIYHVYQYEAYLDNTDPFINDGFVIDINNPLYGYYKRLSGVIKLLKNKA